MLTRTLAALAAHPGIARIQPVIAPDAADVLPRPASTTSTPPPGASSPSPCPAARPASNPSAPGSRRWSGAGAPDLVLVHDAARPFVDVALIERALEAGRDHGAAVPGIAVTDTIKRGGGPRRRHRPGRARRRSARACAPCRRPQAFAYGPLRDAHRRAAEADLHAFTDDGALAEWAGLAVVVFEGDPRNRKITQPADLIEADRGFSGQHPTAQSEAHPMTTYVTRLGTGFDVHAFTEGDHVWLGGVRIPADRGVLAHSDGDVALHALTDALLGAIADGDIGTHFPPSDEQWRGASSDRFLAHAVDLVRARGGGSTTSTSPSWPRPRGSAPIARPSAPASPRSRACR